MNTSPSSLPVVPEATTEVQKLLDYIYMISGKKCMTGQHCNPLVGSTRLVTVQRTTGLYPALFGQDFGFSEPGTWDGINYRQNIVDEAIRRHDEGFVITLMWHAVPPTEDEPVDFRESIMSDLDENQWNELITPGTPLNERWKSQVDVIAWFLKQLKFARVPILWRPYHEMNGDWFWWGKKQGDNGYIKLYRMLFERLTHFHHLNNLIWVFNANELRENVDDYGLFYPGDDVVDILATDVYSKKYLQDDYESLLRLAGNKPVALGEVGELPPMDILEKQNRWCWFMQWGDPSQAWRQVDLYKEIYTSDRTVTLENLPWARIKDARMHHPLVR